jgi:hypothetical protein
METIKQTLKVFTFSLALLSCSSSIAQDNKPNIQIIDQSEKYKIVDNIFKIQKLFGDSSSVRLKSGIIHPIDTGTYEISVKFYARWGIYINEGTLKKNVQVKPKDNIKVYLVGGDYSGIYATDPKLEIDK